MKDKLINILFALSFIAGLSLILYPTIANIYNNYGHSKVIQNYAHDVSSYNEEQYREEKNHAIGYNRHIASYPDISSALAHESQYDIPYNDILDVGGISVMGVLEIPVLDVELPIYHGTEQDALQVGIGHFIGSSLPIGGVSTHSVLTGHTGLSSSKLLTDLDLMEKGDIFYIRVLNDTIAYEVDQIKVVLPKEVDDLNVVQGKDYCTLVTCTPYGINSHRLLVRGKRIEYISFADESLKELQVLPLIFAISFSAVIYLIGLVITWLFKKYRRRH